VSAHNATPISAHIARMQPRWEEFKRTNAGLEFVQFCEPVEGTLGVMGVVTSQVQIAKVVQFVTGTHPSWPLWTNDLTVDPRQYQYMLDAPARARLFRAANGQALPPNGSGR
jgi:hypothetical protein